MAVVGVKLIGQKLIEQALVDAFETWASEDINDAHWQDQFKEEKWNYVKGTCKPFPVHLIHNSGAIQ